MTAENQEFWTVIKGKRKEMKPLQDALGKLRGPRKDGREGGSSLCSSEAELDNIVSSSLFVLLSSLHFPLIFISSAIENHLMFIVIFLFGNQLD